MTDLARRLGIPLVQRFAPTAGPGGLVGALLSRKVGADARNAVHVTRYADVREVLERDDDFSVRLYDRKMTETTGPFYLGMNERERYDPEATTMLKVVRKTDVDLARRIAREEAALAIAQVRSSGKLDVVRHLADVVPIHFVIRYNGTGVPDPLALLRLYQTTSRYVSAFWSDPEMQREARAAGAELRRILSDIVSKRRLEGPRGDSDVIGRMLELEAPFSDGDAGIARSVAGLSSQSVNAPIGLFVHSVDKLMSLGPAALGKLHELARAAENGPAEWEAFAEWVREAQRFSVYPAYTYRYAERDVKVAAGTPREKAIPEGTTVVTWQSVAAFDPDVFERPFDFVPGRPRDRYNGFGHARHRCLGEHIGEVLLQAMAQALFALPALRRAPRQAGRVQSASVKDGNYPTSFGLEFGG